MWSRIVEKWDRKEDSARKKQPGSIRPHVSKVSAQCRAYHSIQWKGEISKPGRNDAFLKSKCKNVSSRPWWKCNIMQVWTLVSTFPSVHKHLHISHTAHSVLRVYYIRASSCLHCAQVGKQEKAMLEWMSRMSQPKERQHCTTTLVGWATFIQHLMPEWDGLQCSPGTRGYEWGLWGRTWGFSSWKSSRTELFHTVVPVITPASAVHPPHLDLRASGLYMLSIQPSRSDLFFSCWWVQRSPTHCYCTSTHVVKGRHTPTKSGLYTHFETLSVMVC